MFLAVLYILMGFDIMRAHQVVTGILEFSREMVFEWWENHGKTKGNWCQKNELFIGALGSPTILMATT